MTTLHGPLRPIITREPPGRWHTGRWYRVGALTFNWVQRGEDWVQDWSAYQSMTFPPARPDYTADELAKIAAAEAKRARKT